MHCRKYICNILVYAPIFHEVNRKLLGRFICTQKSYCCQMVFTNLFYSKHFWRDNPTTSTIWYIKMLFRGRAICRCDQKNSIWCDYYLPRAVQNSVSPSHRVDEVFDCGPWNAGLLFNGCVKVLDWPKLEYAIISAAPECTKHAELTSNSRKPHHVHP